MLINISLTYHKRYIKSTEMKWEFNNHQNIYCYIVKLIELHLFLKTNILF